MVVSVRGGYEAVCTSCRWPDVCKSLGCDQSQQTADAMRSSYERSLLEFEQYVRSGRYKSEREAYEVPQWRKSDTDAAMEQAMRAGKAAVAAAAQAAQAPRGTAVGPRGALPLLSGAARPAGAAGLMALPGGLQGMQLMQSNSAVALAQAQLAAQLRLQQQAQLLAAQKAGRPAVPGAPGMLARPATAGQQQPQAVNAAMQQQLLMRQHLLQQAQLLQAGAAGNPQLQALLLQQQQAQLAAAAAAGTGRPLAAAGAAAPVLTMAQLQQLQQLQQRSGAIGLQHAAAAGAAQAAAGGAGGQPASSQALAKEGSVNFSALLDGV